MTAPIRHRPDRCRAVVPAPTSHQKCGGQHRRDEHRRLVRAGDDQDERARDADLPSGQGGRTEREEQNRPGQGHEHVVLTHEQVVGRDRDDQQAGNGKEQGPRGQPATGGDAEDEAQHIRQQQPDRKQRFERRPVGHTRPDGDGERPLHDGDGMVAGPGKVRESPLLEHALKVQGAVG